MLGLALAYYLAKRGNKVAVIEKNKELGGLAAGFKIAGTSLERYYHHWFKSDTHIQELLEELGIIEKLEWHASKMGIFSNGKLYDFSTAFDVIKFPPLGLFDRFRLGIISFFLQKIKSYQRFENITAIAWCRRYFGKSVTEVIWKPLLQGKFGKIYDQISMSWLWARIFDRSSSRPQPWSREYLGYPIGGFQLVVDTLVAACKRMGVEFLTDTEIINYNYKKSQGFKHELRVSRNGSKEQLVFDQVIATVPAPVFIKIFQPKGRTLEALKKIKYLGAICMILVIKQKFMPYYWLSIADADAPMIAVIEHTNYISGSRYQNKHLMYVAKYLDQEDPFFRKSDRELTNFYYNYLQKINPKFSPDWVEEKNIFRTAFAQHQVPKGYQPPAYQTDKLGLYFANFAQVYPHDRGTNYAVAQAQELVNILK